MDVTITATAKDTVDVAVAKGREQYDQADGRLYEVATVEIEELEKELAKAKKAAAKLDEDEDEG